MAEVKFYGLNNKQISHFPVFKINRCSRQLPGNLYHHPNLINEGKYGWIIIFMMPLILLLFIIHILTETVFEACWQEQHQLCSSKLHNHEPYTILIGKKRLRNFPVVSQLCTRFPLWTIWIYINIRTQKTLQ